MFGLLPQEFPVAAQVGRTAPGRDGNPLQRRHAKFFNTEGVAALQVQGIPEHAAFSCDRVFPGSIPIACGIRGGCRGAVFVKRPVAEQ